MLIQLFFLLVSAVPMSLLGAEAGKDRNLTPRSDSPTAMRRCGADLENVKAQKQLTRRYVFTGEEVLSGMQYCVESKHALVDDRNTYRVPAGTVGWLSEDGQLVVLEQCVNQARCEGCPPLPLPPPLCPCPPPPPPVQVVVDVPLPTPPVWVELVELPPLPPLPPPGMVITLVWDEKGKAWYWKYTPLWCVDIHKWSDAYRPAVCGGAAVAGYWLAGGFSSGLFKMATHVAMPVP